MLDWKSNILSPVLVAVFLGAGTILYNKLEEKTIEYNKLVSNHPEVMDDLRNLRDVKDEMQKEYKYFRAKTNNRLIKLEKAPQTNLKPIYNKLSKDSLLINKVFSRLDYLRNLH